MARILIAEDDTSVQLLIKANLEKKFSALVANNGLEALEIIETGKIDLLITDINMPIMDGITLVKSVREEGFNLPIIMLTAKQTFNDKKGSFNAGADDYVTKPIDFDELDLRIYALMRRANISTNQKISIGSTTLDELSYTVTSQDKKIELPKKEFELLFKLLSYPNQIFTQQQLLNDIWGLDSYSSEDTVKTHISRLRKSCADFTDFKITTVRGLGYKGEINA
ncbi:response regulator transcription factor [Streptococcus equinus]|uniref:response regulator transcription factor n=1 Tax=Streptococcus equinus TaxID=1335 RepID=UPI00089201AF|nr:response regulator transcription factor [Streptococcus equinus]SDI65154.1 DNA-binding response regulator, OmpR family, contains REC and winged-helix (wHTH) domain [Streptococcus equinus]SEP77251.1 DNA-binding response regulator, OmpR family, contains REC and winged-helix (wHTH) domain [Streptococcus equinus]